MSHHSVLVENAPRATNLIQRQREQEKIAAENKRMKRRLNNTKGTFDLKQLAVDAERHEYFSDQITKITRRRKVKKKCKEMGNLATIKALLNSHTTSQAEYLYQHNLGFEPNEESEEEDTKQDDKRPSRYKLPLISAHSPARKYQYQSHYMHAACSPTITSSSKLILATDLLKLTK